MIPTPQPPRPEGAPTLLGRSLTEARRLMHRLGHPPPTLRVVEDPTGAGEIVAQAPQPGAPWDGISPVEVSVAWPSAMGHLPEILQEDDALDIDSEGRPRQPDLLRRLLQLIQHPLGDVDAQLRDMHREMTPETASPGMLSWLGERLPIDVNPGWGEDTLRQVLRGAPHLMAKRGSAEGLAEMIALRTGITVKVVENAWPHGGIVAGRHRVGREVCVATIPFEDEAFYVALPEGFEGGAPAIGALLDVVDQEKPMHLRCCALLPPKEDLGEWTPREEPIPTLEGEALDLSPEEDEGLVVAEDISSEPGPDLSPELPDITPPPSPIQTQPLILGVSPRRLGGGLRRADPDTLIRHVLEGLQDDDDDDNADEELP